MQGAYDCDHLHTGWELGHQADHQAVIIAVRHSQPLQVVQAADRLSGRVQLLAALVAFVHSSQPCIILQILQQRRQVCWQVATNTFEILQPLQGW